MKSSALLGYWLAFAGVLILSPDALLIRLAGDDPWQITAWRGTLSGLVIVAYCAFIGQSTLTQQLKPAGWLGLLGVTVSVACSGLGFIYGITHSNVTDVLVIIAFTPLMSALLSAIFLKEPVRLRTWIATLVCGVGLAILLGQADSQSHWTGLVGAFVAALGLAAQFVFMRSRPQADLTAAIGLGNILSGMVAMLFASTLTLTSTSSFLAILATALIIIPVPFILFAMSLRYITAAETSLIMLIESVLGSFWVWLFLGELPSQSTVLGGILVLSTLTIYSFLTLKDMQSTPTNTP
ncbi:MAG: hypothetical protein RLZZ422_2351 [Pseudomonadota bacterium]|jgi:drug/metabolite transporter (DMT)-like permease